MLPYASPYHFSSSRTTVNSAITSFNLCLSKHYSYIPSPCVTSKSTTNQSSDKCQAYLMSFPSFKEDKLIPPVTYVETVASYTLSSFITVYLEKTSLIPIILLWPKPEVPLIWFMSFRNALLIGLLVEHIPALCSYCFIGIIFCCFSGILKRRKNTWVCSVHFHEFEPQNITLTSSRHIFACYFLIFYTHHISFPVFWASIQKSWMNVISQKT